MMHEEGAMLIAYLESLPPYVHTTKGRAFLEICRTIQGKWKAGYWCRRSDGELLFAHTHEGDTVVEVVNDLKECYDSRTW